MDRGDQRIAETVSVGVELGGAAGVTPVADENVVEPFIGLVGIAGLGQINPRASRG